MAILPHDELLALHEAIVSAELLPHRSTLLGGIDQHFVAGIAGAATPSGQLLEDLVAMNKRGALADGSVPLAIWLMNAVACTKGRIEEEVFRAALERCTVEAEPPAGGANPKGAAAARHATPGPVYNIHIIGGTVGALALGHGSKASGSVEQDGSIQGDPAGTAGFEAALRADGRDPSRISSSNETVLPGDQRTSANQPPRPGRLTMSTILAVIALAGMVVLGLVIAYRELTKIDPAGPTTPAGSASASVDLPRSAVPEPSAPPTTTATASPSPTTAPSPAQSTTRTPVPSTTGTHESKY